jgi:hypothetical protein
MVKMRRLFMAGPLLGFLLPLSAVWAQNRMPDQRGTDASTCPTGQTCYYVASAGNDSNSGTDSGHPWLTTRKVEGILSTLKPGDEVLFHGGDTWTAGAGNVDMVFGDTAAHAVAGSGIGTTATKPIVFSTYGTGRAIIDAKNVNPHCFGAYNPGFSAKYFTINNFECEHAWATGIYFANSGGHLPGVTISNNYVHDTGPGCATSNGACVGVWPAWTASHSYAAASLIRPPNGVNASLYVFEVRGACTSASTEPTWTQSLAATVSDNSCIWTNVGSQEDWLDWAPSTNYASPNYYGTNFLILPESNNAGLYVYQSNAGCTSGSPRPNFNQTVGSTTSDNTCTWTNTGVRYHYKNQVGLEDDGPGADGVHILNNIVRWGGGHDLIEIHGDTGAVLVQGNIVGPGGVHGFIDSHNSGNVATPMQILSNISTCGWSQNLCGCQVNNSCSSATTPAYYVDNEIGGTNHAVIYQNNIAYDDGMGFQVCPNGGGQTTTALLQAKFYNNTVYLPKGIPSSYGLSAACIGARANSSIDIRNNIFDGGGTQSINVPSGFSAGATEDYNNIGGAQGSPGFSFNGANTKGRHDLSNINPLYVNAAASPPKFGLSAGSPCFNVGLSGLTSGNTNIGAN